jgi:amino acid transporter
LLVLAVINLRGVAESVRVNLVLTCIELAGLAIVMLIGGSALARGLGEPTRAFEFNAGSDPFTLVMSGAGLAFFALVGFEDSVNMAEETVDPQRVFPRALFVGLAITGVIYIVVAFCATAIVPIEVLRTSDQDLLEIIRIGAPWFPFGLFSLIAMCAVANSALINMMMASRLVYGMARESGGYGHECRYRDRSKCRNSYIYIYEHSRLCFKCKLSYYHKCQTNSKHHRIYFNLCSCYYDTITNNWWHLDE